jgi:hypothetical protein
MNSTLGPVAKSGLVHRRSGLRVQRSPCRRGEYPRYHRTPRGDHALRPRAPAGPKFQRNDAALAPLLGLVRHRQGRLVGGMEALGYPVRADATLRALTEEVVKSRISSSPNGDRTIWSAIGKLNTSWRSFDTTLGAERAFQSRLCSTIWSMVLLLRDPGQLPESHARRHPGCGGLRRRPGSGARLGSSA